MVRRLFHPIHWHFTDLSSTSPVEAAAKLTVTPPKTASSTVDEFGLLRSDEDTSPLGKESPSRRHRLLGSLRSIKSLRNLRSNHSSSKKSEEEPVKSESPRSPQTPIRETPSVSLNFEASPADEPMFGPMTRTTSASSSLRVHHSSPITVPMATRNTTPIAQGTPYGLTNLPAGTIPDSPAPLQRASVQEAIISNATKTTGCPASSVEVEVEGDPLPTPMPGTNLPFEDVSAPGIMVTSPSVPLMQQDHQPSYFDSAIPDESGCERTKTLDTESGFPSFDDPCAGPVCTEASIAELEKSTSPIGVAPEIEPASFDEPFPVAMSIDSSQVERRTLPDSNDYGEDLNYVVWDSPRAGIALSGDQCVTSLGAAHTPDSSRQWSDNTEAESTDMTEISEFTSPEEDRVAEYKLLAAIEEIDKATLPVQPVQPPVDDKQALQEIVLAYSHFREGTGSEDETGGIEIDGSGIAQDIKEEVETSIRVMNRSLGG